MNKKNTIISTILCLVAVGGVTAKLTNDKYSWIGKVTNSFKKNKETKKTKVIEVGDDLFKYTMNINLKGLYEKYLEDETFAKPIEIEKNAKGETLEFCFTNVEVSFSITQERSNSFELFRIPVYGYSSVGYVYDYTNYEIDLDKTSLCFVDFEVFKVESIIEGTEQFITLIERGV